MNTIHPLAERRAELGLSQRALAEQVGCKRWMINRIECRERMPSRKLAASIQEATGIDARLLLDLPMGGPQ